MSRVAIVIPALDCEQTIGEVVRDARRFVDSVTVIDDGSRDSTAERAVAAGATVVNHGSNRGKGMALLTGMRWASGRGFEGMLSMDGDGQHLSDQIPVLLRASQNHPDSIVIGARQIDASSVAPIRLFGNRFANRWVEIACGQALPDTQSGFRIYPLPITLALGVRARGFAFETEVLIRAARAGVPIHSVAVRVYNPPPAQRVSHYRGFVDTVRIIFVVLGLILRVW